MSLNPRKPLIQDAQLQHSAASGPAAAGSVVYIAGDQKVACVSASGHEPFGLLGQNVLVEAGNLPKGFRFPGQLGSSDAYLGDPVMVAHGGGTYETHNYYNAGAAINAGDKLYAVVATEGHNGKLTNDDSGDTPLAPNNDTPKHVATAMSSLTAGEVAQGSKALLIKLEL